VVVAVRAALACDKCTLRRTAAGWPRGEKTGKKSNENKNGTFIAMMLYAAGVGGDDRWWWWR